MGIVISQALALGEQHILDGYSYEKASRDTFAHQCPPHPRDQEDAQFNEKMVAQSLDKLPPLHSMAIIAFGGNHSNSFLRSVLGR